MKSVMSRFTVVGVFAVLCALCGFVSSCADDSSGEGGDAATDSDSDSDGDTDTDTDSDSDTDADGDIVEVCDPPVEPADTSSPDHVITDCDNDTALRSALAAGGIIAFDCGGEAVINITEETALPNDVDTVLDGGNQVTLDGGGATRLLTVDGQWWQQTATTVTVQNITIRDFRAEGSDMIPTVNPNPNNCSQGFVDGDGGALWFRDVNVRVIGCTFEDNIAADHGPDTAGGAIRLLGTSTAIISGNIFRNNQASNGGAVGALFGGEVTFANNRFENNEATGWGANDDDTENNSGCPVLTNGQRQIGSGGNGGAVCFDGGDTAAVSFCGDVFTNNTSGAMGGSFFRTANISPAPFTADRVLFEGNASANTNDAAGGPGVLYLHRQLAEITACSFVDNSSATGCGAVQADSGELQIINSTFHGNEALDGVGGCVCDFQTTDIDFCTFADNHADGGSGLFAGAIFGFGTTINNSILADNSGAGGGNQETCNDSGHSGGNNLQWPEGHSACTSGTTFGDPQLGDLTDNGGPTPTQIPAANDATVLLGNNCPTTDQTGQARPTPCTLGAVEK